MIDFNQGRFSSVSSSSSAAGGRQTLNELEGRMELGIELGEEVEEEAHLSPAYRSESSTESWIMSRTLLASQVIVMNCMVGVVTSVVTVTSDVTVTIVVTDVSWRWWSLQPMSIVNSHIFPKRLKWVSHTNHGLKRYSRWRHLLILISQPGAPCFVKRKRYKLEWQKQCL